MTERTKTQLLMLIKAAMWQTEPDANELGQCQWDELMKLAKEQTVLGLAVAGMKMLPRDLQPDRKTALGWLGAAARIQDRNELIDKATVAITNGYRKLGIRPLIMKGQVVALEYPTASYRESGDIDICFRTKEEALKAYYWAIKSPKCKTSPIVNGKEQAFILNGVVFENHLRIADMSYGPYQKAMQQILNEELSGKEPRRVIINGHEIETLPISLTFFHLIVHLAYHVLNEGIGLRQFCDLALFIRNHAEELHEDGERLRNWFHDCGLDRIVTVFARILHDIFGLDNEIFIRPTVAGIAENDVIGGAKMIMDDLWTGGNFGKKKWAFKSTDGFFKQKFRALPLHWAQYRKYHFLFPNEALANFLSKFGRAAKGVK